MSVSDVRDQPTRLQRAGSWLFSGHLLAVFSIAASNILLGFTLLTAPFSLRFRRGDWPRMAPLLVPLGIYALWLVGSAFASFDPRTSLGGLRELFTLSAVLLATSPLLVRECRIANTLGQAEQLLSQGPRRLVLRPHEIKRP